MVPETCSSPQTEHITLSSTPYRQLENQAPNTTGSNHLYNTLELLMMGIMVLETCWASNKICNKNHLLHLVGILFPHRNNDFFFTDDECHVTHITGTFFCSLVCVSGFDNLLRKYLRLCNLLIYVVFFLYFIFPPHIVIHDSEFLSWCWASGCLPLIYADAPQSVFVRCERKLRS